ncbi:hypothetical protein JQS43_19605 [Natronosporangium hydrolyticum]|uniref:ABC transporter permease n=1 Tax=Natronosporangium hydrolyticum TaxID=2811111 RepID=A0A895Y8T7_9ACTN|nr:hypothetical protein [Natronosporangium hydrolyticum]QSB13751.1 hypothetical protein JQS43_19605 [Natronosporangium hydrolyticum]
MPIKGQHWFLSDVQPSLLLTLAVVVTVVAVLTVAALTGLIRAVRDPIGTYRSARPDNARLRWWSVVFIGAVVALFWLRSDPFVAVAFTFAVILGWGLISTGPWIVAGLGRLLARRASRPATFLAGRRLSDSPHSAWRAVGGMALAAFLAGFVAISLPVGLGNVSDYASRANHLDFVVPSRSVDDIAHEVASVIRTENLDADVEATAPPFWLGSDSWATLSLTTHGPDSEIDRARTALTAQGLWGPELRLSDDLPTVWMVQDGIIVSLLLIPIAALVALASMVIGTVARILDQRGSLLALSLSGTPQSLLIAVQRREIILPTVLLAGVASIAGIASGASLGVVNPLNPYTLTTFAGVMVIGAIALLLADLTMRPVLERVSTDLSERE